MIAARVAAQQSLGGSWRFPLSEENRTEPSYQNREAIGSCFAVECRIGP